MVPDPLPFEADIHELELLLEKLEASGGDAAADEIRRMKRAHRELLKKTYENLTPWQTIEVSRHKQRPQFLDYVDLAFDEFVELHGDRAFGDDRAIRTGFARLGEHKILLVGHHKGRTLAERQQCFYGCTHPEGYRKALGKMRIAAKFGVPIVCLIDTPGAYPGDKAEERGQSQLIATSILEMTRLPTPIVCVVIGEGGSGGALAIGLTDRILMLEHAVYSVISPEGCASILWKDGSKADEAASRLRMTAPELLKLKVVDRVVEEPAGGAHQDPHGAARNVDAAIREALTELLERTPDELVRDRYDRFRELGSFVG
ncbi:MAG: acetyl-CoA carboxylase carboxyltransferase subunit alpha [Labilithrix sp.]|nr:acetyl-CoA carboxylase carboxyltransferase subunit alpha [Labilithrix sp.]